LKEFWDTINKRPQATMILVRIESHFSPKCGSSAINLRSLNARINEIMYPMKIGNKRISFKNKVYLRPDQPEVQQ
jgi:hypothetical protein